MRDVYIASNSIADALIMNEDATVKLSISSASIISNEHIGTDAIHSVGDIDLENVKLYNNNITKSAIYAEKTINLFGYSEFSNNIYGSENCSFIQMTTTSQLIINEGEASFYNNKTDVIDRLAGSIKLDKTYEELMDERYSKI